MNHKQTLLLVDGSSYLYRAFHAMPDLRNAQGQATGAIYGVINMMRRIVQDYPADYMACVFDAKGNTFRDELYDQYKATRPAMPDDLRTQIPIIHQALKAMGWHLIIKEGVEADDVIGTLSHQASKQGMQVWISTGDKDMAQLVNPQVTLVNTMTNEVLDEQGVYHKFSVRPEQIIDFLMLKGDAVDNIPGVNKCGDKTAAKWLATYDHIDNLIAHADEIKGKIGESLRTHIDQGLFDLTRQLVTIKLDCDLSEEVPNFEVLRPQTQNLPALLEIFKTYGFRTWLKQTQEALSKTDQGALFESSQLSESQALEDVAIERLDVPTDYRTVTTEAELENLLLALEKSELTAVDTETVGLDNMTAALVGMSFATQAHQAWYVPLRHAVLEEQLPFDSTLSKLKPWLENPQAKKVLHHAKFDSHVFANVGIVLRGIAHDTMLEEYVLDSTASVSLEKMALKYLGKTGISYESLCGKGAKQITFDQLSIEQAAPYACEDVDFTYQIHQLLYSKIVKSQGLQSIYQLELQVSAVLFDMERQGVRVNKSILQTQSQELGEQLSILQDQAYQLAGTVFNLNSPKQLGEILFDTMKLPVLHKTKSGTPSTDEETLTELARDYPLPKLLLEYRSLNKLKTTYTDKLPEMIQASTGRVHTHFAQAAVYTGRLASSNPNLQNIPIKTPQGRKVRDAFEASPGCVIVSADYSQIELRIMAEISGDQHLQQAFIQGLDIHRATAAEMFGVPLEAVSSEQRRAAKAINFGLIYGMGAFGLASHLGISRDQAQAYIQRYFARYPMVADYMQSIKQQAAHDLYVSTLFGRRLWLRELASKGANRARAERVAINAPMQGTAADLIKKAMVAVQNWLLESQLQSKLILQVHDELLLEVPETELETIKAQLPQLMCQVANFSIPLEVEVGVGLNWGQAH